MTHEPIDSVDKLENVYLLYGEEGLLMEEWLRRLSGLASSELDADFNVEVIDAGEEGADRVIYSAETVPLMSERRIVIARNFDALPRSEHNKLAEYVENQNPDTVLILVARIPEPGGDAGQSIVRKVEGSPVRKAVERSGEVLKFSFSKRSRSGKVFDWASDEFRKRGKKASPDVVRMLIAKVGEGLRDLEDAVERLCLFAADRDSVTSEDVLRVVSPSGEQGVFELVDAVGDRRRDLALYKLNKLIRQGESPQRLFALLLRQFRLIARVKPLAASHPYPEIASMLGIPPFLVSKCARQSKRFSAERLRECFGLFKKAQLELFSSKYLADRDYQSSVLESLIYRIIG